MQDPIRSLADNSGKEVKSALCNLEIVSKFKWSGFKSLTWELISLILPSLSNTAGFSLPFCPTLYNFIFILLLLNYIEIPPSTWIVLPVVNVASSLAK